MRDLDYSDATDFLARFFGETTEHAVEIRALPNERGAGRAASLFGREPELAQDHCRTWDKPGRAVYFGVATRLTGAPTGTRADLAELPALWADIDTDKHGLDKAEVAKSLLEIPLPPGVVIDSGGGIHAYWLLREALDVRAGQTETEEAVTAALKQLAGVCGGDTAVCDIARIMRLPGTHNTKTGEMRRCRALAASWVRHEFDDIIDMLDWLRPVVSLSERSVGRRAAGPSDPFSEYAKQAGIKIPVDIEQRIAAMSYLADSDAGIHQTQLHVSASMVAQGEDDEKIVALLLAATRDAAGLAGENWNWKREERIIRTMIASARAKFTPRPLAIETTAADASTDAIETPQAAVAAGGVVNLAEQRKARQERKSVGQNAKEKPLIARVGDAVIEWWQDTRGRIAVVAGQPYTYRRGLWHAWERADLHALKVSIQGVLAASKIDPKTQLLNAVSRYVIEHPDLMREGVEWDNSGYVVCLDGAIDPLSREAVPHSSDHWATAGAEINIADMGQGCPEWLAFLDGCFSDLGALERAAVIAVLSEWFGAAMVRKKPRELRKALWLYGESRTGKTRIAEVLRALIGEPTSSLKLRALEKNFGGSALIGKRAWIADDAIGSADEVDDALFKVIVTGEAFSTDVKNQAHETLRLAIPVLFTSNPLPRVKDQSDAVFNRALLIHMRVVRGEEETAGIRPIDEIVAKQELAGVFSWALDGWATLSRRGRFVPPESMLVAASEFKTANNPVVAWAKVSIEASSEWMVDRRDIYASFKGWYLAEYGESAKVPSQKFLISGLRQCMTLGTDEPKRNGYPHASGVRMTDDGLTYRRESARDLATSPGSGCPDSEVNRPRPVPAKPAKPSGKEPRF